MVHAPELGPSTWKLDRYRVRKCGCLEPGIIAPPVVTYGWASEYMLHFESQALDRPLVIALPTVQSGPFADQWVWPAVTMPWPLAAKPASTHASVPGAPMSRSVTTSADW